jgi:hypothetical protein
VIREQRQRLEMMCAALEQSVETGELPTIEMLAEMTKSMREGGRAVAEALDSESDAG